jgi:hypothetical protein
MLNFSIYTGEQEPESNIHLKPHFPLSVPKKKEFIKRLNRLQGSLKFCWVSQFFQCMMRDNDSVLQMYDQIKRKTKLQKPYVWYATLNPSQAIF